MKLKVYEFFFKRFFDALFSFILLFLLSPLLMALYFLVLIKIGSPAIYCQERPGKNGKIFKLYKFRTMSNECDQDGKLLPDERRLTKFGLKLRSSSLDELPELYNILVGDLSFVGPRPLLVRYLPRYNKHQAKRHNVRPGLTGLAQVNGRNLLSWEEKFELDVQYVNNVSFVNDMKILLKTFLIVFKREGISSSTSVTMEEFMGDKS